MFACYFHLAGTSLFDVAYDRTIEASIFPENRKLGNFRICSLDYQKARSQLRYLFPSFSSVALHTTPATDPLKANADS